MTDSEVPVDQITVGEVYRMLGRIEKGLDAKVSTEVYAIDRSAIHNDISSLRSEVRLLKVEVQKFAVKVAGLAASFNTIVMAAFWYLNSR